MMQDFFFDFKEADAFDTTRTYVPFKSVEIGVMSLLQPGDPAPDFVVTAHNGPGSPVGLLTGKSVVVLYFIRATAPSASTTTGVGLRRV